MSSVSGGFLWDFANSETVKSQTFSGWTKLQGPFPWAGTSFSVGEGGADTLSMDGALSCEESRDAGGGWGLGLGEGRLKPGDRHPSFTASSELL